MEFFTKPVDTSDFSARWKTGIKDPNVVFDAFCAAKPIGVGIDRRTCRSIVEAYGGRILAGNRKIEGAVRVFSTQEELNAGKSKVEP